MKTLEPTTPISIESIIDRTIVLNLCQEALDAGVKLRSIPARVQEGSAIMRELMKREVPGIEAHIRNYEVDRVDRYRVRIGRRRTSLCPWAIQMQMIRLQEGAITVSWALRALFPVRSTQDRMASIIGGPVGVFARKHGFNLCYCSTAGSDVIFFAAGDVPRKSDDDPKELVRMVRENVISPRVFCRAVGIVYETLRSSMDTVLEVGKLRRQAQDGMALIHKKGNVGKVQASLNKIPSLPVVEWKKRDVPVEFVMAEPGEKTADGKPVALKPKPVLKPRPRTTPGRASTALERIHLLLDEMR